MLKPKILAPLLSIYSGRLEAIKNLLVEQTFVPVHFEQLVVSQQISNGQNVPWTSPGIEELSLQTFQLILFILTCLLLVYTCYRVNSIRSRSTQEIEDPRMTNQTLTSNVDLAGQDPNTTNAPCDEHNGRERWSLRPKDAKWLESLGNIIEEELSNEFLRPIDLAESMGICERQLQRKLKVLINTSPAKYLKSKRLEAGYQFLQSGSFQTISEVAYQVGYKCPNHFSKCFKKQFGLSPNDLLNGTYLQRYARLAY